MGMACSTNGEARNSYGILVEKPEEKQRAHLEKTRCRREVNIKINIRV
jgi:hypothetical protein